MTNKYLEKIAAKPKTPKEYTRVYPLDPRKRVYGDTIIEHSTKLDDLAKAKKFVSKHPGKASLIAGAGLASAAAIGYGAHNLSKQAALEKIALNALEKHLANQPPDKVYANPKINRAQGLIQKSKEALKTGAFAKQYGGSAEAVKKYSDMARTMLQRHRSLIRSI